MTPLHPRSRPRHPRAGGGQYLTFSLGEEVFAMNIANVREIIQYGPMTHVPLMPSFLRGMINLRGSVVPVIDLQARFGRGRAAIGKKSCNVIFDAHARRRAHRTRPAGRRRQRRDHHPADQIEAPPNFGASVRRDFINGMGKVGGRFVIILEPDKALDVDEMSQLCDAAQEALAA
jgi:purine-binding chemotaxis protein CheW